MPPAQLQMFEGLPEAVREKKVYRKHPKPSNRHQRDMRGKAPFYPGDLIRGKKDTTAAQRLRDAFGVNAAMLTRPCALGPDGKYYIGDRPASEFKRLNAAACRALMRHIRHIRKVTRFVLEVSSE